jgi:hypothetical protein
MFSSKFGVGVLKHPGYNGKGDSGPAAPTNQTVTQTNLPEYARPYFENLLNRTQAQSYQNYQPYGGQRIAGFTPEQQNIQAQFATMQDPGQFNQATQGFNTAGGMGMTAANQGLNRALSYNPNTQMFGQSAANYYSNPYQQNVTNAVLREAQLKGTQDKNAFMGSSLGRGTFGGARQALLQAEQNRGLNQQMSDIQNKGSSDAYLNAQAQFNADQQRSQQAQQYAASLGQGLYGTGMQNILGSASGLGALGTQQQAAELQRLNAQQGSAAQSQALTQTQMDTAYQDFLRQRDYPQEQLGFYSNILRGLPVQLASTQQSYAAPPNMASQIAGAGLGALSLGKLLG